MEAKKEMPKYQRDAIAAGMRGKKCTDETRRKMSDAHKGKVVSDETRKRMSIARANRTQLKRRTEMEKINKSLKQILDVVTLKAVEPTPTDIDHMKELKNELRQMRQICYAIHSIAEAREKRLELYEVWAETQEVGEQQ